MCPYNFGDYSPEEFARAVSINFAAALFSNHALLTPMRRQGGDRIIHTASQLGSVVYSQRTPYGMMKAALIYLIKSLAYELSTDVIIVNAISPRPILTQPVLDRKRKEPEEFRRRFAYIPPRRLGSLMRLLN